MRIIGLTGGIASGKSTVGRIFRELGAPVLDADEIAREIVAPGEPAYAEIVARFGPEVLQAGSGSAVDRARLAERVFHDDEARRALNAITHPHIARRSADKMAALGAAGHEIVLYEATLIVENGLHKGLAGVIVVDLPEDEQQRRAVARGLSASQATLRIKAQASRKDRLAVATWVIDNRGSEDDTRQQVESLWRTLQAAPPQP